MIVGEIFGFILRLAFEAIGQLILEVIGQRFVRKGISRAQAARTGPRIVEIEAAGEPNAVRAKVRGALQAAGHRVNEQTVTETYFEADATPSWSRRPLAVGISVLEASPSTARVRLTFQAETHSGMRGYENGIERTLRRAVKSATPPTAPSKRR